MKRLLAFVLALIFILSIFPLSVFAATTVESGNCGDNGDNVTWTLDSEGTLTISGSGNMGGFPYGSPWNNQKDSVKNVIINSGVTSIGSNAFEGCSSMTSIVIPEGVTSIGVGAFYGCSSLTSVTIPSSVTSVGGSAFYGCSSLTSVTIPEGVTSIGYYAFEGCSSLTSITIPEGVTSIETRAFNYCSSLTSITIPSSVTSIGVGAFWECSSSLESISVAKGNTKYHSEGNCLIETESKTLILGCKNSVIPSDGSVTSIGNYAFYLCNGLTSITIPESVTSIGYSVFDDCSSLESISVAKGNTKYHSEGNCLIETASKALILGCKNSVIPSDGSVTSIGKDAFQGCSDLTSITIPESVTSIGDYAFDGCSSLTNITIPEGVTSIGDDAFYGCSSLTSITIPSSVTYIGRYVFSGCSGLESISVAKGNTKYHSEGNCLIETARRNLILGCKNSVIPSDGSVTSIGNSAFYGCSGLTSITIPEGVTSIGSNSFDGCSSLESISVAKGNTKYHSEGNCLIKTASKALILGCKNSVIPSDGSVTSIGDSAFMDCSGLTSITIPEGVTSIGDYAFMDCSSLTSITIPSSVTSIGYLAFWECSNLKTVYYSGSQTEWQAISIDSTGNTDLTGAEIIYNHTHQFVESVVNPTCTEEGYTLHKCESCGEEYKDTYTEAPGHQPVIDPEVPATDNEPGKTEGSHCERCEEVLVKQEVIPPLNTLSGDVNGDSRINIADAMVLFGHVAGNIKTLKNEAAADVTKDGKINIADAMKLFAYVSGSIKEL